MDCGILWVTFGRDLEWFRFSAASYTKFATGFSDAVCMIPAGDWEAFEPVCRRHGIRLLTGDEWPGRGHIWHCSQKCQADMLLPSSEHILHMDADCVFSAPATPAAWFRDGLPAQRYTPFAELHPDREGVWKPTVDRALGGDVQWAIMMTHPFVFHRSTYETTRRAVETVHPEGFDEYVRSCEPVFPQGFCEFETLGAIAQTIHRDRYHWDRSLPCFTDNYVEAGWSHGGLDALNDRYGGRVTARQRFAELGLEV